MDEDADIDESEPAPQTGERWLPTPAQIAEETAKIRAGWDEATERSRRAVGPTRELYYGDIKRVAR